MAPLGRQENNTCAVAATPEAESPGVTPSIAAVVCVQGPPELLQPAA